MKKEEKTNKKNWLKIPHFPVFCVKFPDFSLTGKFFQVFQSMWEHVSTCISLRLHVLTTALPLL